VKWLKRLFGKLKSTTEEAPAGAPPAAAKAETPAPAKEAEPAAEVAAEVAKPEPVAEPAPEQPAVEAEPVAEPAAEVAAEVAKPEPVAEPAEEPVAAPAEEPVKDEAAEGPFGPGSAKPLADGAAPTEDYTVKGKRSSKLFHTAESPYFGRTKADVWFKTPADAESAGFAAWNHKKKASASK